MYIPEGIIALFVVGFWVVTLMTWLQKRQDGEW